MEKLGYLVTFNPPGDGDCFYSSAAQALGLATQSLKMVVVKGYGEAQMKASDWSKSYANHL